MENRCHWQSSRKAYRAQSQRTVAEIMDSSESPEDSVLDSLSTSIEKLQQKAKAIGELNSKISGKIQNPEELEKDVYEAVELQDSITDLDRLTKLKMHTCRLFWICHNQGTQLLISELFMTPRRVILEGCFHWG